MERYRFRGLLNSRPIGPNLIATRTKAPTIGVHFMRNLHGAVSAKQAPVVTAAVKTSFAHTEPAEVAAQWDQVADTLESSFPKWRR